MNPKVPDDLAELDRWAVWRMENGAKIPYRASGRRASSVNPLHWGELESARAALAVGNFTGLAFAFFKEDGLVGIDLDNSLDADGNAKPEFRRLTRCRRRRSSPPGVTRGRKGERRTLPVFGDTKAMNIQMWPIDRPKDSPRNTRKWSAHAVAKVGASIKAYGWRQPVVVDSNGIIVIGHLRRAAGKAEGFTECPVHVARDLTPAQARGLRLADNRTNQESVWDLELLGVEFRELQALDFDLSLTAFDTREIDQFTLSVNPAEDQVPPVPEVPVTRSGDLWILGPHRVLCADATSPEAVARLLGERKPLLMVTDPPYGIELDSEWRDRAGLNGCGRAEPSYLNHRTAGHTETTISGDTRADWSEAFELVPSLQAAYAWHASKFTREVLDGLLRIGFLHHQQIIWNKGRAVLTRTPYWFAHEPCWFVRKKNAPWFGKAGENTTVWDSPSPKFIMGGSDEAKFDHPTQKPVELMRRPILNHIKRGELVYDPFLGSGTTLAAAELTERICLGIELDAKYVDVIVQRWQNLTGKSATLEGDSSTFERVKSLRRLEIQGNRRKKHREAR